MTITDGVGVTECQDDWTIHSIFEDWISDRKLSRRKTGFLETVYTNTLHDLTRESCLSPKAAPEWMRSELNKSWLLFEIQCVADLLDFLKPRDVQSRENEIFDLLDNMELL